MGTVSVGAVSHQEIEAWARLFRIDLEPCEVFALRALDRAYRSHVHSVLSPDASMGTPENNSLADSLKDVADKRRAEQARTVGKPKVQVGTKHGR